LVQFCRNNPKWFTLSTGFFSDVFIDAENMNAFAVLSLIYFLFTIISSIILYCSFRKKLDASAIYFLLSELSMATTCAAIFLVNIQVIDVNATSIGIPNFGALAAELCILFSLLSIVKPVSRRWFILAISMLGLMTILLESMRSPTEYRMVILVNAMALTCLFVINYFLCRRKLLPLLQTNGFMRLFGWFELGLVGFGLLRLLGSFIGTPVIPREVPTQLAIITFALYLVVGTFRYLCYVGFRMTWVDPNNPSENFLNKPLVKAIEEKQQFLQGFIASNRMIGVSALASSLAHQLSQPLTTIAFRAATTRRESIESEENSNLIASLNEISTQSEKLADLVHNLRKLFGAKSDQFKIINLQKITNEILEIITPTLEQKKITLLVKYQINPMVFGDSVQLQQVLINIFNNASEALSEIGVKEREISITLSEREQLAVMTIADNGPGINSAILSSMFELYNTTKENGLGVGLWLSKIIIEKHQGQIRAFNRPNGGAMFEIELPLHQAEKKTQ
jgi:signal transduction histidine kinase